MIEELAVQTELTDQAAISLVENLVCIPSVSGQEGAAVAFLVGAMQALGFDAHVDGAGNAIGVLGTGPEIVLLGHIDTVPGAIPVRIADGVLWGRGAVDAKGSLAAFVAAAARAHHAGLAARIVVIGCVEEEVPSSRGAHYVLDRYRPQAVIVGEPSGWNRVTLGYKGSLRATLRIEQPCAHSAHATTTPAERIVAWWSQLQAYARRFNTCYERPWDQLLPTLLAVDSGSDGLHAWARADLSVRLPPTIPPSELEAALRTFDQVAELVILGAVPAWQSSRSDPLVRTFNATLRQHGTQPTLVLKTGTADMNVVGPVWNCPIVAYGPGDAALDHTPHEHLVLAEYLQAIGVLEGVLRSFRGHRLFTTYPV